MSNPSNWNAYWFIRSNRFRKKRTIYNMLISLSIDKTTAVYSLIVGGYVFASIFIFNDFLDLYQEEFQFIEQQAEERFWLVLTIVPLRFIFQSFRHPGVLITSSEYRLGMLPYSIQRIGLYCAAEKWLKQFVIYSLISTLIVVLTPINSLLVWSYFFLFWCIEILMTVPHWKLFQARFITKLLLLLLLFSLNVIGVITNNTKIISITILVIVVISNVLLIPKLYNNINWGKVAEVNDYLIWSMPIIARATKIKFKRQSRFNILQNSPSRKMPFAYKREDIHKRLWFQHFRGNLELVVKVVGTLFLTIVILNHVHDIAVLIGIALSIHVYTTFVASLFIDRFHSGIVEVLPWEVEDYQKTVKRWVLYGSIPLALPTLIFIILHFGLWSPLVIMLVISTFLFNYIVKMRNAKALLDKKLGQWNWRNAIAFCMLGLIVLCGFSPFYALSSFFIVVWLIRDTRIRKHEV